MKRNISCIRCLLCILLFWGIWLQDISSCKLQAEMESIQQDTPEELQELYAQSAVLMDADSGRILFEKNGREIRPMASTTKIMTCILALELGDLDAEVEASETAVSQPKVRLGMTVGSRYTLRDLLYSLMLESHNDSAVAIAEHISGSVEAFARLMNRKAESIGIKQTHFITPNGLDAQDDGGEHSTTAADLAAIMKYCIRDSGQKEMFLEITETQQYSFTDLEGTHSYSLLNHNAFLGMMDGALSGKTGFTGKAGYCYVGALQEGDRCFIVALLACGWPNNKGYKWSDTKKLMNYALKHYQYREVWEEFPDKILPVADGITGQTDLFSEAFVPVKAKTDMTSFPVLLSENEEVTRIVRLEKELSAPVKKGTKVGSICYELNGKVLKTIPIIADQTVERRNYFWVLYQVCKELMLNNIN